MQECEECPVTPAVGPWIETFSPLLFLSRDAKRCENGDYSCPKVEKQAGFQGGFAHRRSPPVSNSGTRMCYSGITSCERKDGSIFRTLKLRSDERQALRAPGWASSCPTVKRVSCIIGVYNQQRSDGRKEDHNGQRCLS